MRERENREQHGAYNYFIIFVVVVVFHFYGEEGRVVGAGHKFVSKGVEGTAVAGLFSAVTVKYAAQAFY